MTYTICDNCNLPSGEALREVPVVTSGAKPAGAVVKRICEPCNDCLVAGDVAAFEARHEHRPRMAGLP